MVQTPLMQDEQQLVGIVQASLSFDDTEAQRDHSL